jgi:hypothetical protein
MDIRVPEELQPILRDFTKAVLRDRPDDVLEYSKAYFVSKWEEQRMGERAPCERRASPPYHACTAPSTAVPAHLSTSDRPCRSTLAPRFNAQQAIFWSLASRSSLTR